MTLTVFANYLNHHQVLLMDELFVLLGSGFHFVATLPRDNKELKGGIDFSERSYCILATEGEDLHNISIQLAKDSDVSVFGSNSTEYAKIRASINPLGLSFEMGERWFKKGLVNVLSPHFVQWYWNYLSIYRKANFYRLCNSAFAALDLNRIHAYRNKCYKWGYFTKVYKPEEIIAQRQYDNDQIRILWCSRFINWKHPEIAVKVAKKLRDNGFKFKLTMIGIGEKLIKIQSLVKKLKLDEFVVFLGSIPNEEVVTQMRQNDIFLFTSDRNEGWGAVANEAMANGCVLIGSNQIGSVPYLVENGINGIVFESCNVDSLYNSICYLVNNREEILRMSLAGIKSMYDLWSPKRAAESLIDLCMFLLRINGNAPLSGPCSRA